MIPVEDFTGVPLAIEDTDDYDDQDDHGDHIVVTTMTLMNMKMDEHWREWMKIYDGGWKWINIPR